MHRRLKQLAGKKLNEGSMSGLVEGVPLTAVTAEVFVPAVIPVFDGESEEALALRYSQKPRQKPSLVYEFTRDPELLHQYYRIFNSQCRVVSSLEYLEKEEQYNKRSHIMVVREGNLVVGGARITINTPRQNHPLPLEIGEFRLTSLFPDLEAKQQRYAEFSRLAVLPDYRGADVLRQIIINVYRKCVALDIHYIFAAAPLVNGRSYRQICKAIGLTDAKVYMDIDIPPAPGFEEVKDYLFAVEIFKSLPGIEMTEPVVGVNNAALTVA